MKEIKVLSMKCFGLIMCMFFIRVKCYARTQVTSGAWMCWSGTNIHYSLWAWLCMSIFSLLPRVLRTVESYKNNWFAPKIILLLSYCRCRQKQLDWRSMRCVCKISYVVHFSNTNIPVFNVQLCSCLQDMDGVNVYKMWVYIATLKAS